MFGASRPTFGNTGASPFGQQPTGTFVQPQATANAFGSTTNNAQSGFGGFGSTQQQATPSPFGMSQQQQSNAGPFDRATSTVSNPPSLFAGNVTGQTAAAGTSIKPFTAYTEKDATTGMNNLFQSISCMPEYKNHSFEELRFQDYQANNKYGQGGAAAGGNVASTFGSQANNSPFGTNNQSAFGVGNANATSTGGLFGQANNNSSNSPFGQPGTSPFGQSTTGTAFGQPSNSPFGQTNATANSPFGLNKTGGTTGTAVGGLFGQNNTGTAFGQNTTTSGGLFGQANNNTAAPFGQANTFSRANNTSAGGLFGQNSQPQQTGGIFGSNNNQQGGGLFGQTANTQQQQTGGLFGSNPTGTLGQTNNSGGLFGQSTGLFGQNNNTNAFGQGNNSAGGLFGQNTQNQQQGDMFSQQNNQQNGLFRAANQQDGGLFGQNNQQQSSGLFGQDNSNNSFRQPGTNVGGGMFGSKPNTTGGFGQPNVGGTFGQSNIGSNAPSGGLFGQNNQQQQGNTGGLFGQNTNQPQTGGLFGQANTTQPGTVGLFGQNNNSNQQSNGGFFGAKPSAINSSGGMFANKVPSTGGLFGNANPQTQPGGGLFGQNSANSATNTLNSNQQPTIGGGLFGNKPATTTGSTLFGNTTNAQNNNPVTGGGLFGNNQATNTQLNTSSGGGLFGSKPADPSAVATTGGLFAPKQLDSSSTGTATSGLFGAKPSGNSGTGLFGAKPSNAFSGGFFSNSAAPQNTSSNLNPLQQPVMGSSVSVVSQQANNPYGTNDLFSRVIVPSSLTQPSKPSATKVNADNKKKASLTSAYRLAPKPLFSTRSKTTIPVLHTGGSASNRKSSFISSSQESVRELVPVSTGSSSIFTNETDELILSSSNKLFNPDKKSFKNLILNRKKMEDSNADENAGEEPRRITFTSGLSDEQEMSPTKEPNFLEIIQDTPVATKENLKVNGGLFAPATLASTPIKISPEEKNDSVIPLGIVGDDISFTEDGYYLTPSLETLSNMTLLQLRKVTGLAIGQKEYGKIDFLDPVDLSNISLPTLCGTLVRFSEKVCEVSYVGNELPKPGDQLNVKARITLYNTFPTDKATRQPIKDPKHPILKRHIEKLKKIEHTKFESYDVKTGSYIFVVDTPVA